MRHPRTIQWPRRRAEGARSAVCPTRASVVRGLGRFVSGVGIHCALALGRVAKARLSVSRVHRRHGPHVCREAAAHGRQGRSRQSVGQGRRRNQRSIPGADCGHEWTDFVGTAMDTPMKIDAMKKYHFISGLPRSGSTLLAALLLQNPRFHAGMTSPVGTLFTGMLQQFSAGSEFGAVLNREQRHRLSRGLFETFYADQVDKEVIFDTNRLWCAKLPALLDLFPNAKIIACVRNVAWIMDSLERLYRANPYENTRLFVDDNERSTVASRVETLAQRNRLVGYAWEALKEAYYGEQARSMLVVEYELLSQAPEKVLRLVYDFIGEPWFEHDYENVRYDATEFDQALGVSGLHKARAKVELADRRTVLPPDLFEQYAALSFWQNGAPSAANVIRINNNRAAKIPISLQAEV